MSVVEYHTSISLPGRAVKFCLCAGGISNVTDGTPVPCNTARLLPVLALTSFISPERTPAYVGLAKILVATCLQYQSLHLALHAVTLCVPKQPILHNTS